MTMLTIGETVKFRTQTYECVGYAPHVLQGGRTINMCHLKTTCPDCGGKFQVKATISDVRKRIFRRRCDDCKAPGVPVEFRMPRRNAEQAPKARSIARPVVKKAKAAARRKKTLKKVLRPRARTIRPPALTWGQKMDQRRSELALGMLSHVDDQKLAAALAEQALIRRAYAEALGIVQPKSESDRHYLDTLKMLA